MKKILILTFFIFNSFLLSDELLTYTKRNKLYSYCIADYYYSNNKIYFNKSSSYFYNSESMNKLKDIKIESGYILKKNKCILSNLNTDSFKTTFSNNLNYTNLTTLGLSNNELNLMFALSGVLTSFLFLFGITRQL